MHQPGVIEQRAVLLAHAVYIHHVTADEMLEPADYLRRTAVFVGTLPRRLTRHTYQGGATGGTDRHKPHGGGIRLAGSLIDPGDLRYNLATLLDIEHIVLVYAEIVDNVLVVQRRALDDGPREQYGLKISHGSDDAHAAYLERYEPETRQRPLGGKLVCDGPAG